MAQLFHVLLAILLTGWIGLPFAFWICRTGERRTSLLLLNGFAAGILVLGMGLQCFWLAGWNVHRSTPWLLGIATVCNLALGTRCLFAKVRPRIIVGSGEGLLAFALVAGLMTSVYIFTQGKPYYGRAWGDQLNYSLTANFLQHESPAPELIPFTRPAAATLVDSDRIRDRIGQSFLHAWVSEITGAPVQETHYLAAMLGVLAVYAAACLSGLLLGLPSRLAACFAFAISISPPIQAIHLESFLSQIVVTPYVIYAILTSFLAITTGHRVWLVLTALGSAWVFTAYFEFLPVLAAGAGVTLVMTWVVQRQKLKWVLATIAALGSGIGAGFLCNNNLFSLMSRIGGLPGFEKFYPWAYQREGVARLLVGDTVLSLSTGFTLVLALATLAMGLWGTIGLGRLALRERNSFALALVAVTWIPPVVGLFPGDHAYPYYKLLQSFWPFSLLGVAVAAAHGMSARNKHAPGALWAGGGILIATLGVCSVRMLVVEATGQSTRSGLNPYLRLYGRAEMLHLVAGRPESKLVINMPNRLVWNDLLANGTATLQLSEAFPKIQSKWLRIGDRLQIQPLNPAIPADHYFPEVRSVHAEFLSNRQDLLVLQIGSSFVRPAPRLFEEVGSYRRMHLFKQLQPDWIIASSIVPPYPGEFTSADDGVMIGCQPQFYLRMDLESNQELPAGVGLEIRFEAPVAMNSTRWHIYSNTGYGIYAMPDRNSLKVNSGPLRRGVTEIFFGPDPITSGDSPAVSRQIRVTRVVYGL